MKTQTSLSAKDRQSLRLSLVVVWVGTALVSLIELEGQSVQLLHAAGIHAPWLVSALIWGGIAADTALGLALWLRPSRTVYLGALGLMLVMTLLATALQPSLWLHPLGPLLKNLPIGALLWVLAKEEP